MNTKRVIVFVFTCVGLFCRGAAAQQEAIPSYAPGLVVGYADNGAGFAFSPNVNISVTALGYAGDSTSDILNEPCQVSLFDSGGNLLASQTVSTGSAFFNQSYYDAISSIQLIAGQTYYMAAAGLNNAQNLWVGEAVGGSFGGSYSVNSDISYLYGVNGILPPGGLPGSSQGNVYLIGANMMFFVTGTPEPSTLCLFGGMSACVWAFSARRRRR